MKGAWEKIPARVEKGAQRPALLELTASAKVVKDESTVRMRPSAIDEEAELSKGLVIKAVLYQKRAVTKCTAGENEGKTLTEYFNVVESGKSTPLTIARDTNVIVKFAKPDGVPAEKLGVAILVEESGPMRTLDCWTVPVE